MLLLYVNMLDCYIIAQWQLNPRNSGFELLSWEILSIFYYHRGEKRFLNTSQKNLSLFTQECPRLALWLKLVDCCSCVQVCLHILPLRPRLYIKKGYSPIPAFKQLIISNLWVFYLALYIKTTKTLFSIRRQHHGIPCLSCLNARYEINNV